MPMVNNSSTIPISASTCTVAISEIRLSPVRTDQSSGDEKPGDRRESKLMEQKHDSDGDGVNEE